MSDGTTDPDGTAADPGRRRRLAWWIGGAVVLVVVIAVAAPFIYIHVIEGPPPAELALPTTTTAASGGSPSTAAGTTSSDISGTWSVGPGSVIGYRVGEVLLGQSTTAVGRTSTVSGSFTVAGTSVTGGTVVVDMASVKSDQSQRNAQFDGRIMDVATYPTATLHLTAPIELGSVPPLGVVTHTTATATLTMHGVTNPVSFPVQFERTAAGVSVLADIPITFAGWNIANPSVAGLVTTQSSGTLEALLVLTTGTGNPPVTAANSASGSGGSPGGGAPITVPSTTVPPLSVLPGG